MTETVWRDAAIVGLVVTGLACGFVWLVLWADARNQRFYQAHEPRNWVG
jgi:hypothetical protein